MRVPPDQSGTMCDDHLERHLGVAVAQLAGDVGQPGAEQEDVHAVAVVGHRVQEMQQDLRVAAHRCRRCRTARPAAAAAYLRRLRAMVRISPPWRRLCADGAAQVGRPGPVGSGAQPPRAAQVERQDQAADLALGRGDFGGAHRLEIHALQAFLVGHGQHRVLHRRFVLRGRGGVRASAGQRFGDAAGGRAAGVPASSPSAPPAAPWRRPARRRWGRARTGRRPGRTRPGARGGGSWRRAARCGPRSRLPRSMRVSACCAASVSAGPTGSPARRSRRAKCMTLAARVGAARVGALFMDGYYACQGRRQRCAAARRTSRNRRTPRCVPHPQNAHGFLANDAITNNVRKRRDQLPHVSIWDATPPMRKVCKAVACSRQAFGQCFSLPLG